MDDETELELIAIETDDLALLALVAKHPRDVKRLTP